MRVDFHGKGTPHPELAYPDPDAGDALPPLTLVLPTGDFLPQQYIDMGYTHYEVWCVGAAGGRGGNGGARSGSGSGALAEVSVSWPYYHTPHPTIPNRFQTHWHDPVIGNIDAWGGGGGGGGLHVVSGLLFSLPEIVPVVVGEAGADAPIGQIANPNPITPSGPPYMNTEYEVYDEPHRTFYPPVAGGNGGASTFNGTTCRASGGKGGEPATYWDSGTLMVSGNGGAGGAGNRTASGGGAAGATTDAVPPDGSWTNNIGKGGGGGRGGAYTSPPAGPTPIPGG